MSDRERGQKLLDELSVARSKLADAEFKAVTVPSKESAADLLKAARAYYSVVFRSFYMVAEPISGSDSW